MNFDAIVLGTGGVGSAAMFHLAERGVKVLGLDRFPPGHNRGSSHGESRVIRRSYFEHPDYVPLLQSAYTLWDELSDASGEKLLHRNGVLYFGSPAGSVIKGILESAAQHQIDVDRLSARDVIHRFPQFVAPENSTALFEPDAGYLLVERCVKSHINQAILHGATHRYGETILNWSATDHSVHVETDRGHYDAAKLVFAAGSWTDTLLTDLQLPLHTVRKHQHWYIVNDQRYQAEQNCPCYFYESAGGYFYGCPALANGLKVAEHSGGTSITDPLNDSPEAESQDTHRVETFLKQHLPGVSSSRIRHERCFYTMTPDEHFIIDHHPEYSSVVFAAGLSGHGFKFTSAIGQALAELTLESKTTLNLSFLRLDRAFAST